LVFSYCRLEFIILPPYFIPPNDGALGFGLVTIYIAWAILIPLGIFDIISILLYSIVMLLGAVRRGKVVA
jgi:hypothetical protein